MSDFDFEETQRRNKENKERVEKERLKNNHGVCRSYNITSKNAKPGSSAPPPPARTTPQPPSSSSSKRSAPSSSSPSAAEREPAKVLLFKPRAPNTPESGVELLSETKRHIAPGSLPANSISFVAVDRLNRLYAVFAGKDGRGALATSADGGRNWAAPDSLHWRQIQAASLESDSRLYLKTTETVGGATISFLHGSADGGRTWQSQRLLACPLGRKEVYAVSAKGDVYVGTSQGIFRSRDRGKWEELLPKSSVLKDPWTFDLKLGPLEPVTGVQKIYAMSRSGLLISADWGKTWRLYGKQFASTSTMVTVDERGVIYLGSMGHGIRISKDFGSTWIPRALPEDVQGCHVLDIRVKSGVIYATLWDVADGGHGLAVSKDEGRTWRIYTKENSDLSDNDVASLWITDHGRVYAGTLGQGISVSNDDLSGWEVLASETTGSFKASP